MFYSLQYEPSTAKHAPVLECSIWLMMIIHMIHGIAGFLICTHILNRQNQMNAGGMGYYKYARLQEHSIA